MLIICHYINCRKQSPGSLVCIRYMLLSGHSFLSQFFNCYANDLPATGKIKSFSSGSLVEPQTVPTCPDCALRNFCNKTTACPDRSLNCYFVKMFLYFQGHQVFNSSFLFPPPILSIPSPSGEYSGIHLGSCLTLLLY